MSTDDPKIINDIKARLDETYLSERILAAPTKYDIAVSVVCDIKCPLCPRQRIKDKVRSGYLKPKFFEPLVPWLQFSNRTGLYGLGEPFLNKNFYAYLEESKRQGSYTMTSSHGMSLNEDTCARILDMGLDELAVSIDACTPALFNRLREGADFRTVIRNVRRLIQMRNARATPAPRIHIACALSTYNWLHMPGMVLLAKFLGADQLVFSNIIFVKPEDARLNITGTRRFRYAWAVARRLARLLRLECFYFYQNPFPWKHEHPPIRQGARFGCPSAWSAYVIERDGNLKPCCYLDDSLGNSADSPDFSHNFNNEPATKLRRSIRDADLNHNCRECGMLMEVSPGHVERCLRQAREMIAQADLSPSTRAELLSLASEYEARGRQHFRNDPLWSQTAETLLPKRADPVADTNEPHHPPAASASHRHAAV